MTWENVIAEFFLHESAAGLSRNTLRQHRWPIKLLSTMTTSPTALTLRDYERAMAEREWGPASRRAARTVYRNFSRWLVETGRAEEDHAARLAQTRLPRAVPRPIPDDVLAGVLERTDGPDRWMVLLGAHAGLRCCEIAQVHTDHLAGDTLTVRGKGGDTRAVPIVEAELRTAIRGAGGWLLPNRSGGHLAASTVSKRLSAVLPEPWTAHTLRHRSGSVAYEATRDLLAVGAMLGHARTETTQRYCALPGGAVRAAAEAAAEGHAAPHYCPTCGQVMRVRS